MSDNLFTNGYLADICSMLHEILAILKDEGEDIIVTREPEEVTSDTLVTLSPEPEPDPEPETRPCKPYVKVKGNKRWNGNEESVLIVGVSKGASALAIADTLNRTSKAIRGHISLMEREGRWPEGLKPIWRQ